MVQRQEERAAVGRCSLERQRGDLAAGTAAVVHDHLGAERFTEPGRQRARHGIGTAARREADQQAHGGLGMGARRAQSRERGGEHHEGMAEPAHHDRNNPWLRAS